MGRGLLQAAGIGVSLSLLAAGTVHAAEAVEPNAVALSELNGSVDWASAEPAITPTADLIPEAPVVAPPAPRGWTWAVTPRAWLLWETDHYFQSGRYPWIDNRVVNAQISNQTTFIPFAGGTVSATPGFGSTTYSLTALYGEGSGKNRGLVGIGEPFDESFGFILPYEGEVETTRLDVEGIAQIPAATEGLNWILGARFIRFERDEEGTLTDELLAEEIDVDASLTQHFYLGEAGFGVARPVNAAGSFIAFGNLVGMLGYADVVEHETDPFDIGIGVFNMPKSDLQGGVLGVDTNAGFGYRLSPRIFASARYRLFYLTAPDFEFRDGATFMHGPEFNVTFTFGG